MGHKPWDMPWRRAEKRRGKQAWKREVSDPEEPCASDIHISAEVFLGEGGPVPLPGKYGQRSHPPIVVPVAGRYEIIGTQQPDGTWDTRVTLHDDDRKN